MTPPPTTTLQAARRLMDCRRELHMLDCGLGTLAGHLTDPDQMEQARTLFREAHERAAWEFDQALRTYEATLKKKHGRYDMHMHVYNLEEIAMHYAWK